MGEVEQPVIAKQRPPLWVMIYSIYLILSILLRLFILGQSTEVFGLAATNARMAYELIADIIMIIIATVAVVGLWRMTRWGLIVAVVGCILEIALALVSIVSGGGVWDYFLPISFAAVLILFYRNRAIFTG